MLTLPKQITAPEARGQERSSKEVREEDTGRWFRYSEPTRKALQLLTNSHHGGSPADHTLDCIVYC